MPNRSGAYASYLKHIFTKLRIGSRVELATMAVAGSKIPQDA